MRRLADKTCARVGRDAGYTLTEMLVVIGIIALIAAVLTPGILGQLGRARAKSAQMQLESVAAAVESFRSDVNRYPTDAEGLNALVSQPGGVEGWTGPYLKSGGVLQDPWGHPIAYHADPNGISFTVTSLGRDGVAGGTGLDADLVAPAQQ